MRVNLQLETIAASLKLSLVLVNSRNRTAAQPIPYDADDYDGRTDAE
jgi:hypothetical protein